MLIIFFCNIFIKSFKLYIANPESSFMYVYLRQKCLNTTYMNWYLGEKIFITTIVLFLMTSSAPLVCPPHQLMIIHVLNCRMSGLKTDTKMLNASVFFILRRPDWKPVVRITRVLMFDVLSDEKSRRGFDLLTLTHCWRICQ